MVGKNLRENFFDALDRYSPNLMEIFRKKKGLAGQLLAELLRQTKVGLLVYISLPPLFPVVISLLSSHLFYLLFSCLSSFLWASFLFLSILKSRTQFFLSLSSPLYSSTFLVSSFFLYSSVLSLFSPLSLPFCHLVLPCSLFPKI